MKESTQISILCIILAIIGLGYISYAALYSDFTFSSSEIKISNLNVQEKLTYNTNNMYHTLYRNFKTPIFSVQDLIPTPQTDFIMVGDVFCQAGKPYYRDSNGIKAINIIDSFTESNEYGCSFGNEYGFQAAQKYTIGAAYSLHPKNIFDYNGHFYVKFVAYSSGLHPFLVRGRNFIIDDNILSEKVILPNSDAILYVPLENVDTRNYYVTIIDSLYFGNNLWNLLFIIGVGLGPALICLLVWLFFGKEKKELDFPSELSMYPEERKAWEVSAYFHPPFGELDENFVPTMILDFYNRKIIDIQERKEGLLFKTSEVYIKINDYSDKKIDPTEKEILDFLEFIGKQSESKDGYFSINKESKRFMYAKNISNEFTYLKESVKNKSKEHIEYTGNTILSVLMTASIIIIFLIDRNPSSMIFLFVNAAVIGMVMRKSSLFIRFKDDWYIEYQKWQGFRKYLTTLDSIKRTPTKGVVMWEQYLVYATAMGAGKKVLEELKQLNIIDAKTYNSHAMIYSPNAFGSFSNPHSGGGAGGMGGGGGIGGGGGGGR